MIAGVLAYFWQRFLWLGWIGKGFAIAALLYGTGWLVGTAGLDELAVQFGQAGLYVVAFPLTALIIRGIWRHSTAHHRK